MTQAEYARHREGLGMSGGTRQAVARAVEAGRISTIGSERLIDPKVADIQWEQNSRARASTKAATGPLTLTGGPDRAAANDAPAGQPAAAPVPSAPAVNEYQDARTRREQAEASKAELELAKLSGRVIDRVPAQQAVYDAFHALRDAVLATPRRTAAQCVGINDVRELEHIQTVELRKAFDAWEARMLATLNEKAAA